MIITFDFDLLSYSYTKDIWSIHQNFSDDSDSNPSLSSQGGVANISDLLGLHPTAEATDGAPLNDDIATRWENYLTKGLDPDQVRELTDKYKTPSNCKLLKPPEVNPEIAALLTESSKKGDTFFQTIQVLLGKAMCALGELLNASLDKTGRKHKKNG